MLNKVLLTPVDKLVEIVKTNNNCSMTHMKKQLKVPLEIIEKWLIILEEYNIIKVQYKGFEGYITYIEKNGENNDSKNNEIDINKLKDEFIERSKLKDIGYEKIGKLWSVFIMEYEEEIKKIFYEKAKKKGYESEKIEKAWLRYKKDLENL